jgi:hypothetical protein
MVFGTPSSQPFSAFGFGVPTVMMGWRLETPSNPDRIVVFVVQENGAAFNVADAFTWDVMVVGRPAVGHSIVYHGNRSYTNPAFPPIAGAPASVRPDYRAGYPEALINGVNTIVQHNSNEEAAMLLFGYKANTPGAGFIGVPYIVDRGTANESTVDTLTTGYAYPALTVDILTVSPHSIFTSLVVPHP